MTIIKCFACGQTNPGMCPTPTCPRRDMRPTLHFHEDNCMYRYWHPDEDPGCTCHKVYMYRLYPETNGVPYCTRADGTRVDLRGNPI